MLLNTVLSLSLLALSVGDLSPQPVDTINVEEYVGKWYEIGKLPTPDQPNCFNVTADYELLDDGQVGVINSCRIKLFWGLSFPWFIGGKAKAVEGEVGQFDLTLRPLSAIIPFGNKLKNYFDSVIDWVSSVFSDVSAERSGSAVRDLQPSRLSVCSDVRAERSGSAVRERQPWR